MQRNPRIFLNQVPDIILVQIKLPAQGVQAQIFLQMIGNIIRNSLVAGQFFFLCSRILLLIDGAVEHQDQVTYTEVYLGISPESVRMNLLQQRKEFASGAVKFQQIQVVNILFFFLGMGKQIQIIRRFPFQSGTISNTEPEYEALVGDFPFPDYRPVQRLRRYNNHISRMQRMLHIVNHHINTAC